MLSSSQLLVVAAVAALTAKAQSTGVTTRYWDCCKTSCAWSGKASVSNPVGTCNSGNNPLSDPNAKSACDSGGTAYACANNSPWAVSSTLAYGYAAVNLSGQTESNWCCACYQLTFTSGPPAGQTMIVQATNTGGDVGGSQFDLMIPGGGVGAFPQGCTQQYGSISSWGATYGGVSSDSQCNSLPAALQAGCHFRFGWFKGADNPNVTWKRVQCPAAITSITGCVRSDDGSQPPASTAAATTTTTTTTTTSPTTTPTTTARMTTSTTTASTTTTASHTTTASAGGATQSHWGQCGGTGYSGPTNCAPYTCTYSNAYYSQCL